MTPASKSRVRIEFCDGGVTTRSVHPSAEAYGWLTAKDGVLKIYNWGGPGTGIPDSLEIFPLTSIRTISITEDQSG